MRPLIVIVNYRTADLVVDCLRSLVAERAALGGRFQVTVVDNASDDGSAARLADAIGRHGWQEWVTLMPLAHNRGFAAGNNEAIGPALASDDPPDCVMLLNPDTVVEAGAIVRMVRFLESRPEVGIVGAMLLKASGEPDPSSHRGLTPWSELESAARFGPISRLLARHAGTLPALAEAHRCDWVSGAALMMRTSVLRSVGLLDEGYFLYFDEVDYCLWARRAGWEVWCLPQARIVHLEGASTRITQVKRRASYWFDSRRRYFIKGFGVFGWIFADLLWAIGRSSLWARTRLGLGGSLEGVPPLFTWDLLSGDLRALVSGRAWGHRMENRRNG